MVENYVVKSFEFNKSDERQGLASKTSSMSMVGQLKKHIYRL